MQYVRYSEREQKPIFVLLFAIGILKVRNLYVWEFLAFNVLLHTNSGQKGIGN